MAPEVKQLRVVIVDDHELVRRGVKDVLAEAGIRVVGEAASVTDGRHLLAAVQADIAILDVGLPDGSGLNLCRELRSARPEIGCVIFTAIADKQVEVAAAEAGASAYVNKQSDAATLIDAVRHGVPRRPAELSDAERPTSPGHGEAPRLTEQERKIKSLLLSGYTQQEIAEALDTPADLVEQRIGAILAKTRTPPRP